MSSCFSARRSFAVVDAAEIDEAGSEPERRGVRVSTAKPVFAPSRRSSSPCAICAAGSRHRRRTEQSLGS